MMEIIKALILKTIVFFSFSQRAIMECSSVAPEMQAADLSS